MGRMDDGGLRFSKNALRNYLSYLYNGDVEVFGVWKIGEEKNESSCGLKRFGYGFPYIIEFKFDGEIKRVVLETMRSDSFGHEHFSDRAQIILWQNSAFNKLPRHVRSIDVGVFAEDEKCMKSLGKCGEFFILTEFVDGKLYHYDLDRIKETGRLTELDEKRCLALSDYLAEIHKIKHEAPRFYVRRIRELVGHGECILGLLDSYPSNLDFVDRLYLIAVEKDCVVWRWRLKDKSHRLSQVHGDFHPWNVLFRRATDFTVLDRSRGEWGEPADDVTAMTINYIFYSLQKYGKLYAVFERLFKLFWDNYLRKTRDSEILEVVQPFYAWRCLVLASPIWYPNLSIDVRIKLLNFGKSVLQFERFDLSEINSYIELR